MEKQLARLAVAHVLLVVYAVFSAAVFLKIRYGTSHPSFIGDAPYAIHVLRIKEFGLWLLGIPAVWSFYSFWRMRKPSGDASTFANLYASGVAIVICLFFLGLSTARVLVGPTVQVKEPPREARLRAPIEAVEQP